MYWLPSDNLRDRVKIDKIPYDQWYSRGLLRLCEGNCINYSDVTAWFMEMVKETGLTIAWVYYDSYSAKYWVQEMTAEGFNMERCIQGAKTLSLPMQMLGVDLQANRVMLDELALQPNHFQPQVCAALGRESRRGRCYRHIGQDRRQLLLGVSQFGIIFYTCYHNRVFFGMVKSGDSHDTAFVYAFGVGIELSNQSFLYAPEVGYLPIPSEPVSVQRTVRFYHQRRLKGKCFNEGKLLIKGKIVVFHELRGDDFYLSIFVAATVNYEKDATVFFIVSFQFFFESVKMPLRGFKL